MLSAAPGVELGLDELLEMRHRLHEARLFSSQNRRSPLVGLHHSRLRGRGEAGHVSAWEERDGVGVAALIASAAGAAGVLTRRKKALASKTA